MPTFRAPRGTRDLLPAERAALRRLETVARTWPGATATAQIETPLFEQAAVFERGVGEVTDVVEKELFRLAPRTERGRGLGAPPRADRRHRPGLRPARDADAGRSRCKLTLTGPMFRYDRPQAGRFRQFWQFDVEAIGDPGPAVDAEIIELALALLPRRRARATSSSSSTRSATPTCRPAYVEELTAYFRGARRPLPPLERDRLERTRCGCSTRRTRRWSS